MLPSYCRVASLGLASAVLSIAFAQLACAPAGGGEWNDEFDPSSGASQPIRNNTGPATAYPESALVDMGGGLCSGSVIAPRVALTAGHCVADSYQWTVTTPYAKGSDGKPQTRKASSAWTDYQSWGGSVNPNTPDVALLFFDNGQPFDIPVWPLIQETKLPNGTQGINVGRINNGSLSYTNLYVGAPIAMRGSSSFPYSYESVEVIQSGDSGGPVFLPGSAPHTIVAVNSGAGGGQILARTDAVIQKIKSLIDQHGGPGAGGGAGTGGSGGDPGAGGGAGGSPPTGDCQVAEQEPNNSYSSPQSFEGGVLCGNIESIGAEDWFTWSVPGAGVSYEVSVDGADTQLSMWKFVNGQYYQIGDQGTTSIKNKSNGAGPYYIVVWSPTGATGDYRLTVNRSDLPGGSGGVAGSAGSGGVAGSGGAGGSAGDNCDTENEPNDKNASAQAFDDAVCGTLPSGADQDWFTFSVAGAGVHYLVDLDGGDARVAMWKYVNGQFYPITNTSPTTIENTSNGPGSYYMVVWSPSGASQSYRLNLDGPSGTGGSGGGGAAGAGGSAGSGGAAGAGGAPPSDDVTWLDFPAQKAASKSSWGTLLTDIEQHLPSSYGSQYSDPDTITHAHETTHGINSHLRNYFNTTGKRANGLYVLGNRGVIIVEPGIYKHDVAAYVPASLRWSRYSTYITGQTAWDDTPLYVFDEWVAYTNGTDVGVNRVKEGLWNDGWRDQSGNLEFVVYSLATGMAVKAKDPAYFDSYPQFREFLAWHAERSMSLFREAQAMQQFAWADVAAYYEKMKSSGDADPMRQFCRDSFGADWTQAVMGF